MKSDILRSSSGFGTKELTTGALLGALVILAFVVASDPALAQDPFGSIVTKTESARDQLVTIGQAVTGLMAAVLLVLAMSGRVAWKWVICVVAAGAGLTGLDAIQEWINA